MRRLDDGEPEYDAALAIGGEDERDLEVQRE